MNIVQVVAASVAGISSGLLVLLYAFQEKLLYLPTVPAREYGEDPSDHLMPFDDVELVASDGVRLHAWLIRRPESQNSPTFIYFHGNTYSHSSPKLLPGESFNHAVCRQGLSNEGQLCLCLVCAVSGLVLTTSLCACRVCVTTDCSHKIHAGNIGHRLMDVRQFYDSGFNVLIVSYRGYGESEGSASEKGFRLDAHAAVAYCRDRTDVLDARRIFIFGRSIGGAVAIATAAASDPGEIAGIVVENTFTSVDDMIDIVLPPLRAFKFLNRNPWKSLSTISSVETPILFISGLRDQLVPPHHVKELYDAASRCRLKEFFTVANGTHNDTWYRGGHAYREAIRNFVTLVTQSYLVNGVGHNVRTEQCDEPSVGDT